MEAKGTLALCRRSPSVSTSPSTFTTHAASRTHSQVLRLCVHQQKLTVHSCDPSLQQASRPPKPLRAANPSCVFSPVPPSRLYLLHQTQREICLSCTTERIAYLRHLARQHAPSQASVTLRNVYHGCGGRFKPPAAEGVGCVTIHSRTHLVARIEF